MTLFNNTRLKKRRLIGIRVEICGHPQDANTTQNRILLRRMSLYSPLRTSQVILTNTEMDHLWDETISIHSYILAQALSYLNCPDDSQFIFTRWRIQVDCKKEKGFEQTGTSLVTEEETVSEQSVPNIMFRRNWFRGSFFSCLFVTVDSDV